jgi:hypothetical protein
MSHNILVGTYNMSFAGDLGLDPERKDVYESEGAFHKSNTSDNLRTFWMNALNRVETFLNEPNAAIIGLQEMNETGLIDPQYMENIPQDMGTDAVENVLKKLNKNTNKHYEMVSGSVVTFGSGSVESNKSALGYPGLVIVWDSILLGSKKKSKIVDLNYTSKEEGLTKNPVIDQDCGNRQTGRPMLMLLTEKDYIIVCIQAPNYPIDYIGHFETLQFYIYHQLIAFLNGQKIDKEKIFIVGDFNDRFDGLREISLPEKKLIKNGDGQKIILKYEGDAPRSCCHNWDSSCTGVYTEIEDKEKNRRFRKQNFKDERNSNTTIGYCDHGDNVLAGPNKKDNNGIVIKKRELMGDEGHIKNYRFTSDKVFGFKPSGNIEIYPNDDPTRFDKSSEESDHEMVVGTFTIPEDKTILFTPEENLIQGDSIEGGRRRRTKKARKAKKTLKYKKKGSKRRSKK